MLGAIAGDMVGSVYEFDNQRTKDFELFQARTTFTDDTILTVAVAEVILQGGDYAQAFKRYYRRYPNPHGQLWSPLSAVGRLREFAALQQLGQRGRHAGESRGLRRRGLGHHAGRR
jgi:ADP-ribosylglycohydrolase